MKLAALPSTSMITAVPTPDAAPTPPARWSHWYRTPIARVEYGAGTRVSVWREASIPADQSMTGDRTPAVTFGGTTLDEAVAAAHLLAAIPVELRVDVAGVGARTIKLNPAIAVLLDAKSGAYWLAPLRTTMRVGNEWVDAPHAIDGAGFTGATPTFRHARVLSATPDMVAVVGAELVVKPGRWRAAESR